MSDTVPPVMHYSEHSGSVWGQEVSLAFGDICGVMDVYCCVDPKLRGIQTCRGAQPVRLKLRPDASGRIPPPKRGRAMQTAAVTAAGEKKRIPVMNPVRDGEHTG